ncbi:hypothetical protein AMJ80_08260 [bacterium SM23_31]|nr:MAG: hypothetical protein AMJ80_08260 [bacterium SM23_31]
MKINPKANMRLRTRRLFEACLVVSIILHLVLFMAFKEFEVEQIDVGTLDKRIEMEDIPETEQAKRPPPPRMPTVPVESESEDLMEDVTIEMTEVTYYQTFTPPPPPPAMVDENIPEFLPVEDQPEIIGGIDRLLQLIVYPPMAKMAGVEGKVTVSVLVSEKGDPLQTKILQSNLGESGCNEAAEKAIMQLKFIPAKQRNIPTKFWYSIPVKFVIKR